MPILFSSDEHRHSVNARKEMTTRISFDGGQDLETAGASQAQTRVEALVEVLRIASSEHVPHLPAAWLKLDATVSLAQNHGPRDSMQHHVRTPGHDAAGIAQHADHISTGPSHNNTSAAATLTNTPLEIVSAQRPSSFADLPKAGSENVFPSAHQPLKSRGTSTHHGVLLLILRDKLAPHSETDVACLSAVPVLAWAARAVQQSSSLACHTRRTSLRCKGSSVYEKPEEPLRSRSLARQVARRHRKPEAEGEHSCQS